MTHNVLHSDLGDPHADITSHDTFLTGFPHAAFMRLRQEEPVSWVDDPQGGFWAITKHADVIEVSRDYKRFTASRGIRIEEMDDEELNARRTLMEFDPPEHTRLRRLVQPGFTPKVVATYENAFRELTRLVLDKVLVEPEFDFVTEIARDLPIRMLCRLVGVPESDADQMVAWGDQMISNADPEYTPVIIDKSGYRGVQAASVPGAGCLGCVSLCGGARSREASQPSGRHRDHPPHGGVPDGEPLTDLEFKNFFTLMMVAGNETTRHTISHGMIYLYNHPEQLEAWRSNLAARSEDATEELACVRQGSPCISDAR